MGHWRLRTCRRSALAKAHAHNKEEGENEIAVVRGANEFVSGGPATGWPVLSQLEIPDQAIRYGYSNATIFFLNASPVRHVASDIVERARVVIVQVVAVGALIAT